MFNYTNKRTAALRYDTDDAVSRCTGAVYLGWTSLYSLCRNEADKRRSTAVQAAIDMALGADGGGDG